MSDQTQELQEAPAGESIAETPVVEAEVTAEPTETVEAAEAAPVDTTAEVPVEVADAYQPNFTYKVYGEEKKLPDFLHPLINTKETEDYFRTNIQKSEAYDILRDKHEQTISEHDTYQQGLQKELSPVLEAVQQMNRSAEIKDYDGFFKAAGVKAEDVFTWAVEKAQYQSMPAEQKQAYDQRISTLRENSQLKYENEQTSTQLEEFQVNQRERELALTLEDPTVNQVMQEYDARKGKVGAFREEVVAYANGQWYARKQDLTSREAVEGVLGLMGRGLDQAGTPQAVAQTNSAQPAVVPPRTAKPTIPSLRSGHASPVKRAAKSLDDLRKLAEQIQD